MAILAGIAGSLIIRAGLLPIPETLGEFVVATALVAGLFSIFEARAGWCIVRAFGFRTKF